MGWLEKLGLREKREKEPDKPTFRDKLLPCNSEHCISYMKYTIVRSKAQSIFLMPWPHSLLGCLFCERFLHRDLYHTETGSPEWRSKSEKGD
jgi:hypothetical protein